MKTALSLTAFLFFHAAAFAAGTKDGGGGPSIVCRAADRSIQSVQLLDLYEGRIRFDLDIPLSSDDVNTQIANAMYRLSAQDPLLAHEVAERLSTLQGAVRFLPPGVIMAPGVDLGDAYPALMPDGCELSYVAYYERDGVLRISRTLYDHLSNTEKAALLIHEALYKTARVTAGQTDSTDTRQVTGFLFSTAPSLAPVADVVARLYWPGFFTRGARYPNGIEYHPAQVAENAATLEIGITARNGTWPNVELKVECHEGGGRSRTLIDDSRNIVEPQRFELPTAGCRAFGIHVVSRFVGSNFVDVEAKWGSQTLYSGQTAPSPTPGVNQLNVGIPIFVIPGH